MDKHNVADYLAHLGARLPAEGSGWRKMKCPFHDDSNASASINYDANRFKCFGCGAGGDIYDLIQHERGGTLVEAIEFASTISTTSNTTVQLTGESRGGVSINKATVNRRSQPFSFRSSR